MTTHSRQNLNLQILPADFLWHVIHLPGPSYALLHGIVDVTTLLFSQTSVCCPNKNAIGNYGRFWLQRLFLSMFNVAYIQSWLPLRAITTNAKHFDKSKLFRAKLVAKKDSRGGPFAIVTNEFLPFSFLFAKFCANHCHDWSQWISILRLLLMSFQRISSPRFFIMFVST